MSLSSRDPVAVGKAAKVLVQAGDWRRQLARDDRTKILMSLKARLPFAIGAVPLDALLALTKAPPAGGCYWCTAFVQRDLDKPELQRDDVTLAILGPGCTSCQQRWAAADRAAELVAAAQPREALTASLCRGRPWLAAALAGPAHGPGSLHYQMDKDCWRLGAHRAAAKWGVEPGLFTGERAALHRIARHPVWGPALTRGYGDD